MSKFPFLITLTSKIEALEKALKEAEQKTAETLSFLETQRGLAGTILKSMNEGVLAVDEKGNIVLANPAIEKTFTVIEPELLGKTVRAGLRNNEIAELIEEVAKAGKTIEKEISIIVPIEKTFAAMASPLKEGEEKKGVVCVLHDITEIRKLEQYRTEFVANVSHELKTPLTSIRSYVETLLNGAINDKEHNLVFLQKIEKHALNLSQLIEDILEISGLESKAQLGPFVEIDLKKTIQKAIETIHIKADKKGIEIERKCGISGTVYVLGIEDHLYRAILNLLDNAVNYSSSGGKVTVSCSQDGKKISLSVADTGIGIPPEHLPRIFERFYRVDTARSRELGGTGLGLAIVKHVMNIHNGEVEVASEQGKGTVFTLIFPG
ncbi:MAG: ATP-binding protein [Candidatus Saganbacteria bacterium]|nr:ATP-binding protein [Candidatus Saganbacteria bacterium]